MSLHHYKKVNMSVYGVGCAAHDKVCGVGRVAHWMPHTSHDIPPMCMLFYTAVYDILPHTV